MSYATEAAELSHLSPEAVAALEALMYAMKIVCFVYNEGFRNLHETHYEVVNIWPRALTCYCAILRVIYTASKSFKTPTMKC